MLEYSYQYLKNNGEADCLKKLDKDYYKENLCVEIVKNGLILPRKETPSGSHNWMGAGGVLNEEGEFVRLSGIEGFSGNEGFLVFGGKYEIEEEVDKLDGAVIYMGPFTPHWGHFLLEYCTRLWYVLQNRLDFPIVYCGFNCEKIDGNFLEILELMGIKEEQLMYVRKPFMAKEVIIPEQAFLRDKYITKEYKNMIEIIKKNAMAKVHLMPYDKIYFSRLHFAGIKERGEKEIESIFKKNGFQPIYPEELSASEQIFYVSHCKELAVTIGGASMNAVFASPGVTMNYIKKAYLPDIPGDIFQINELTEAKNIYLLDCYYKPFPFYPKSYGEGPHLFGVTRELRTYIADRKMENGNYLYQSLQLVINFILLYSKWIFQGLRNI